MQLSCIAFRKRLSLREAREVTPILVDLGWEKYGATTIHGCELVSLRVFESRLMLVADRSLIMISLHHLSGSLQEVRVFEGLGLRAALFFKRHQQEGSVEGFRRKN
jgi:hypothetical protein